MAALLLVVVLPAWLGFRRHQRMSAYQEDR